MENIEKGKTVKYLRDKHGVSDRVKDNLKEFNQIKRTILTALAEKNMTIRELSDITKMPLSDVMYYLMSLIKYDLVVVGEIDDMDEYYTYKLKQ